MTRRQTAALTPVALADLLGYQDAPVCRYIESGTEKDREKALEEALHDLWAICNAITAYESTDGMTSTTVVRLAGLGETLVARVVELRSQGEERGHE